MAIQFFCFIGYLKDSTWAERVRSLAILTLGIIWGVGVACVPAVQRVRLAAARMAASNDVKQIGPAMHSYHDTEGTLPPAEARWKDPKTGQVGYPVSWRVRILPYLGQSQLFAQYRMDEPWDGPHNIQLLDQMPKPYACHVASGEPHGYTYYRVFVSPRDRRPTGEVPPFLSGDYGAAATLAQITDFTPYGTSGNILVVEAAEAVPWTKPDELVYDPEGPLPRVGGHFPGGFGVVFADGSVEFIRQDIKDRTMRALITFQQR